MTMAGRNFLFVLGPTNVPDRVLRAMAVPMEDHGVAAAQKFWRNNAPANVAGAKASKAA